MFTHLGTAKRLPSARTFRLNISLNLNISSLLGAPGKIITTRRHIIPSI